MVTIESIAKSALMKNNLETRSLVQDFLRTDPEISEIPRPQISDHPTLAIAAALLELFALRQNKEAPPWTSDVGGVSEPVFLLHSATKMKRLKELCLQESPEPLRKRQFFVPPDYLDFA